MWMYLSLEELNLLQKGLDLLAEKNDEELALNRAKLWVRIQQGRQDEKEIKEDEDENKTKNSG